MPFALALFTSTSLQSAVLAGDQRFLSTSIPADSTGEPVSLPDAVVTSSLIREQPGRMVSLSRFEWELRGVRTVGEALALLPGVTLLDAGAFVRISLRGAPPRMTLVELDGIPHNDP
ncbi:MAG: Plug domain-containing protein, partial [Calditrichaeota bacterium]|nr:Plug domain-containing protein [Calditrichota bacterium]